jgi:hypothetical protein
MITYSSTGRISELNRSGNYFFQMSNPTFYLFYEIPVSQVSKQSQDNKSDDYFGQTAFNNPDYNEQQD